MPTTADSLLETPMSVPQEAVEAFRDQGFVHLNEVLPREVLERWRGIIRNVAMGVQVDRKPLEERDTYGKAFIQTGNLWELDPAAKPFVFAHRLADIARQLLGTSGIRLYHDQGLFKEAGGGHTPWHADQQYWPLATPQTVTAWIPLVDVPMELGPLAFSAGSHHVTEGRDLAISDESERRIGAMLDERGLPMVEEPFDLGDVSFHYGWTYHRAGPNHGERERTVMTMIYMDSEMRLKRPDNPNQEGDRKRWCPGVEVGAVCDSPLNPVLA